MKKENNHEVYAWRNQSDGTVNSSILKLKSHYVSFDDYVTTSHIEFKVVEGSKKKQRRNWSALQKSAECHFRAIYQVARVIPAILFIDSVPFEFVDWAIQQKSHVESGLWIVEQFSNYRISFSA